MAIKDPGDEARSWDDEGRSQCTVTLTYEGPATEAGLMEAGAVAAAISGFKEIFKRANALANGEKANVTVYVTARPGSFVILITAIVYFIWTNRAEIRAGLQDLSTALVLGESIVGAIKKYFRRRGASEDETSELSQGAERLADDPSFEKMLRRVIAAFNDERVESLTIRVNHLRVTITRADLALL